jgi:hypothetical protein
VSANGGTWPAGDEVEPTSRSDLFAELADVVLSNNEIVDGVHCPVLLAKTAIMNKVMALCKEDALRSNESAEVTQQRVAAAQSLLVKCWPTWSAAVDDLLVSEAKQGELKRAVQFAVNQALDRMFGRDVWKQRQQLKQADAYEAHHGGVSWPSVFAAAELLLPEEIVSDEMEKLSEDVKRLEELVLRRAARGRRLLSESQRSSASDLSNSSSSPSHHPY